MASNTCSVKVDIKSSMPLLVLMMRLLNPSLLCIMSDVMLVRRSSSPTRLSVRSFRRALNCLSIPAKPSTSLVSSFLWLACSCFSTSAILFLRSLWLAWLLALSCFCCFFISANLLLRTLLVIFCSAKLCLPMFPSKPSPEKAAPAMPHTGNIGATASNALEVTEATSPPRPSTTDLQVLSNELHAPPMIFLAPPAIFATPAIAPATPPQSALGGGVGAA
mmetsp:Transcript_123132/g.245124  ORF Transcript_123132/g.245124 Transcript_123132/m.245124 type:complete len:220 (+) Transcript_123132:2084-2743(+)